MNVLVNPNDAVMFATNETIPRGFVIIEMRSGFLYISEDKQYFLPRTEAEEIAKREEVRRIFGTE